MADLAITAASVVPGAGVQYGQGIAGATITAGQSLYLDSASQTLKPADASSAAKAAVVGVAAHGASANQPVRYYTSGVITMNAVLTAGKFYVQSNTAGGGNIAPVADLASGMISTLLGYGLTTTTMQMLLSQTGVTN